MNKIMKLAEAMAVASIGREAAPLIDARHALQSEVTRMEAELAFERETNTLLRAQRNEANAKLAALGEFLRGFSGLAHNYSLRAIPPDYYSGTEGDAFSAAYKRCGEDLANLKAMLKAELETKL